MISQNRTDVKNSQFSIFFSELTDPMPVLIFVMEETNRYAESNKKIIFQKNVVPHNYFCHFLRVEKKSSNVKITLKLLIFLQFLCF